MLWASVDLALADELLYSIYIMETSTPVAATLDTATMI
jgi:hypothetical protein